MRTERRAEKSEMNSENQLLGDESGRNYMKGRSDLQYLDIQACGRGPLLLGGNAVKIGRWKLEKRNGVRISAVRSRETRQ
jgi:hypothetical protein